MKSTKEDLKKEVQPLNFGAMFFAVLIVGAITYQCNQPDKPPTREEKIELAFNPLSGAHRELQRAIKKSLKDPKSYEHVSTGYIDLSDHLLVKTTYRATNSFGGVVTNTVAAKTSLNGKIIEIVK